jgi:beta-mannosidase
MQLISLNGEWKLTKTGEKNSIPAEVPGCVHTDLLAAGEIEEPFYRNNEEEIMWIGETDWDYSREFNVPRELLKYDRILLCCKGLDTLATIEVNGEVVGQANNMYRTWEFDLKPVLREGLNYIKVHFDAPLPYLREKEEECFLPAWSVGTHRLNSGSWLRKQPSNFGWDWGPKMVTCGIWRDIEIIAFNSGRLRDVQILQDHSREGLVGLAVKTEVETLVQEKMEVKVEVDFDNQPVTEGRVVILDQGTSTAKGRADGVVNLEIKAPELWWPNGLGKQPLYTVKVTLYDSNGQNIDQLSKRIGLRTLRLVREDDQWGQSFKFAVNGVDFFAKGANWIPADTFVSRQKREDYYRLLKSTAEANMNMLRVWGGGIYEDDAFYEICDELGICIWQDFMFACGTYPTFDEEFMENVRIEAEQNVRRIRHHACLALWCGNNEIEQGIAAEEWDIEKVKMSWEDYSKLFDKLLPETVGKLAPQTDYWPGSPHSPKGDRADFYNPRWGDVHIWDIWHGKKPFEWYRKCEHRFNSEFGFQSFPEPKTVYSYTEPEDRNITSYVMEHHQRSGIGNTTIIQYMLDWFRLPHSFEDVLWVSQILQGLGVKYAVEHWRRGMPRGMGTLYWQLNDCWPVASWSSIDYYGRWKALHYMARKFYAPLLISGLEDSEQGTVEIHVTSDLLEEVTGKVRWELTNVGGERLAGGGLATVIPTQQNIRVETLDLKGYLKKYTSRELMLWLELEVDGEIVSSNFVSFAKPKHMVLKKPEISREITGLSGKEFKVILKAEHPALWTWLEVDGVDAVFSDNFFHLRPGREVVILIRPEKEMTSNELEKSLIIRSLVDTY